MSTQTPAKSTGQIIAEIQYWGHGSPPPMDRMAQIIDSVIDSASLPAAGEWHCDGCNVMRGDDFLFITSLNAYAICAVDEHNATLRHPQPARWKG